MKIYKFTFVIGLLVVLSIQSCKKNYGTPPDLPPMTSFVTDFSDFDSICTCYYHLPGTPLRGFDCQPVKKADDFLGIEFR